MPARENCLERLRELGLRFADSLSNPQRLLQVRRDSEEETSILVRGQRTKERFPPFRRFGRGVRLLDQVEQSFIAKRGDRTSIHAGAEPGAAIPSRRAG